MAWIVKTRLHRARRLTAARRRRASDRLAGAALYAHVYSISLTMKLRSLLGEQLVGSEPPAAPARLAPQG